MIREKIEKLFNYRRIPFLMEFLKEEEKTGLWDQLIDLQFAIYRFDQYLEENWILSEESLNALWEGIYYELRKLAYDKTQAVSMCHHIRRYALHERQLRKAKTPLRFQKSYFYYYKSCDVRLIRQILFDRSKSLRQSHRLSDWKYFDLITEINDDVEDVFEDLATINANAFMISILLKDKKVSVEEFKEFVHEIVTNSASRMLKRNNTIYNDIHRLTLRDAEITLELINVQTAQFNREDRRKECRLLDCWAKDQNLKISSY